MSLWSSIEPLRVDSEWWESTMLPLKQLEAAATSGPSVILPPSRSSLSTLGTKFEASFQSAENLPQYTPRADREDMELDTKLFTEPLPTNQQVTNQVTRSFVCVVFFFPHEMVCLDRIILRTCFCW